LRDHRGFPRGAVPGESAPTDTQSYTRTKGPELGGSWIPVSNNIENLQFQYATSINDMADEPLLPLYEDP